MDDEKEREIALYYLRNIADIAGDGIEHRTVSYNVDTPEIFV